jgi:uncharacterized protein (TIGR02145 family)
MRTQLNKIILAVGIMLASAFTFSCSKGDDDDNSGKDNNNGGGVSCDIKDYGTVTIGDQTWMAKNFNCNVSGSKCYGDDNANCTKYGRLYDWATTMGIDKKYNEQEWGGSDVKHRGICPSGWHIPSGEDWDALMAFIHADKGLGSFTSGTSSYYAGKYLKATSGWNSSGNDLDSYGFSALPGGYGNSDGSFGDVGTTASGGVPVSTIVATLTAGS